MNRRELLLGAAAMAAAATAGRALAEEHKHEHGGTSRKDMGVINSSADCVAKGQICLHHNLVLMGEGDKSLAACAMSVSDLIAVCSAFQQVAASESKYTVQMAKLVMDVCKDTEAECKKQDKHEECRICGEACAVCYKECKKLVG